MLDLEFVGGNAVKRVSDPSGYAESVSICSQVQPVCGLLFAAEFAVNAIFHACHLSQLWWRWLCTLKVDHTRYVRNL